eukprot:1159483-Pelagomonas_calceolata.AAC.12
MARGVNPRACASAGSTAHKLKVCKPLDMCPERHACSHVFELNMHGACALACMPVRAWKASSKTRAGQWMAACLLDP